MTILNLAPLFYFQYIPSNDGPSHVYNSAMLRAFILSPSSPARTIFVLNSSIPPNLLTHSFMAVAMSFFKPVTAERLLVVLYAVLLPLGFRYFLRSVSLRTSGLEYFSLVWVYNSHLHWGFYNFLFSIILFLFSLGYWIRRREQLSGRAVAVLALLITLLYFCHPVGLFEFWIASLAMMTFQWKRTREFRRGLALFTAAAAPAGILYVHYALTKIAVATPEITTWPTLRYSASLLFTFSPLATYWPIQRVIAASVLFILCAGFICATQLRELERSINEFFVAACVCAALVFLAPTSTGGGTMLTPRLVYFPIVLSCAWLARLNWKVDPGKSLAV